MIASENVLLSGVLSQCSIMSISALKTFFVSLLFVNKLLALLMAALLVFSFAACGEKADDKLVIGYTIYEPMNYMEDGKLTGFDTEFAEAVCAELGVDAEFVIIDWDNKYNELFQSVSNGKSLVASAITDKGIATDATDTFATMANNIAVTPACWRDAAAMYEAQGNTAEAMKLYNSIKNEYPNSPIANEAEIKINAAAK